MRATLAKPLSPFGRRLWVTAQATTFIVTLVVVAGLFLAPERTLTLAWYAVVPLLPASFLINAGLWRGICPIASANWFGSHDRGRPLSDSSLTWLWSVGIVLLFLLIPLRRVLLNTNGPALAVLLLAIVATAFTAGWFIQAKGGFCNSVCPVLPVEKLYGQHPLVYVRNPRCVPCSLCSTRGCMDLDPVRAVQENGSGRSWLKTPMGLFSMALPGIILGYFLVSDAPSSSALTIFTTVLGGGVASLVVLAAPVGFLNMAPRVASLVLAALCVGLYYWFAAPVSVAAFGGSEGLGIALRWVMVCFVGVWVFHAFRTKR